MWGCKLGHSRRHYSLREDWLGELTERLKTEKGKGAKINSSYTIKSKNNIWHINQVYMNNFLTGNDNQNLLTTDNII